MINLFLVSKNSRMLYMPTAAKFARDAQNLSLEATGEALRCATSNRFPNLGHPIDQKDIAIEICPNQVKQAILLIFLTQRPVPGKVISGH